MVEQLGLEAVYQELSEFALEVGHHLGKRDLYFLPVRDAATSLRAYGFRRQRSSWVPAAKPLSDAAGVAERLLTTVVDDVDVPYSGVVQMGPNVPPLSSFDRDWNAWFVLGHGGFWLRFVSALSRSLWTVDYCFRAVRCPYCGGPRLTAHKTDSEVYLCDKCHNAVREEML